MNLRTPHLKQRTEFQALLADYRPSDQTLQALRDTRVVLLAGPSSAGRDTLVKELIKTGAYHDIVTSTTRPPRYNNGVLEQHGIEYYFRSEEDMLDLLRTGKLVGPALIHNQQVSGVNVHEFEVCQELGKTAITDLDPIGVVDVVALKPDTVAIFVLPPSFEEWLSRLTKRGQPSPEELRRRLEAAVREFTMALDHDFFVFVINDDLQRAVKEIDAIAHGRHDYTDEATAKVLAQELKAATETYLRE